jgi:hypothetical protein
LCEKYIVQIALFHFMSSLHLFIGNSTTKQYSKQGDFNFLNVNVPHLYSDIHVSPWAVYFSADSMYILHFLHMNTLNRDSLLTEKLILQEFWSIFILFNNQFFHSLFTLKENLHLLTTPFYCDRRSNVR